MKFYLSSKECVYEASPFAISVGDVNCNYRDDDAVPFVITLGGRVCFGTPGSEHHEILAHIGETQSKAEGRFWKGSGALVFWEEDIDITKKNVELVTEALQKRLGVNPNDIRMFLDCQYDGHDRRGSGLIVEVSPMEYLSLRVPEGQNRRYFWDLYRKKAKLSNGGGDNAADSNGMLAKDIWRHYQNVSESRGEKIVISESKLRKIIASVIKEHLNERGTNLVKRNVDEMAYPVGFNMKTLISLPSFAKRLQYCMQYLKKIGAGSSRVVFAVDDEKVLKVAKNGKGIAQNQEEMQDWRQNYYDCFAKVYDASEDGIFLEMQAARRAKDSDFRKLTGYGFDVMSAWIGYTASLYTPRNRITFRNHNFDELFDSEEWAEGLDNYNLFSRVHSYLCDTCSEAYGDLQKLSSWGVVSENGEESLVIIDFGLTEEIFDNYYRRKVQQ